MVEAQGLRKSDRVVRPIAAAGGRTCARPGCPAPARATLTFAYDAKTARLAALLEVEDPASYDLCTGHADRTSPPFGWTISDERPPDGEDRPVDLADEDRTVAVISAALRAVPNPPAPAVALAPAPVAEPVTAPAPVPAPVLADEVAALTEAAEELAGAEVAFALAELSELDAVAQERAPVAPVAESEPEVWSAPVDGEGAAELLAMTLPFDQDPVSAVVAIPEATAPDLTIEVADDFDDFITDGPLSPEGHAQRW